MGFEPSTSPPAGLVGGRKIPFLQLRHFTKLLDVEKKFKKKNKNCTGEIRTKDIAAARAGAGRNTSIFVITAFLCND